MNWNRDTLWIYVLGAGTLALTGYLYWDQQEPEWKGYQDEFRDLVAKRFGTQRAKAIPSGPQQVWVNELGRTDRCTTCHLGIEWKGLENAPNPYRSHPRGILEKHPVAKYGCTICHGGQGYATTVAEAHAIDSEHWERPVLASELAKAYLVNDRHALLETNCNICHRNDRETKGAGYINYGKELVRNKGCRACHTINNRGGVIGPNLTYIGDLNSEQYNYQRMPGKPSVFGWHLAHFKDPKSMSSETVMPNFGFGSREAQSLALLVMSWKKVDLPIDYIPGAKTADLPTPEEKAKEEQMLHGEGAFFVKKTCFICHDVSVLGVESATKIGPDLSIAYADVQSRFGRTLDDFLHHPTGTMAVVLSTQIHLTDEERNEAIRTLTAAYQKKQAEDAKKPGAKK
jgi:cytochrome c551/c552